MAHAELGASIAPRPEFVPSTPNPFLFDPEAAWRSEGSASPLTTYVMVQSADPVDPSECEDARFEAVGITVLWGTTVLHVAHLSPPRPFYVGHGDGVDYLLPVELCAAERAAIVEVEAGVARTVAPNGAELSGNDVRFGSLTFRVERVVAGKRLPRAIGTDARGLGGAFAISLASVAAFMGALAYYTPALGSTLDDGLDRDRIDAMRVYLNAQAERERERLEAEGAKAEQSAGGNPAQGAKGPEGKMGRPDRPSVSKRTAIAGSGERVLSREAAVKEAQSFGLVGMLSSMNARALPTAVWGADVPNGPDASDAWGELYGKDIGESGGLGGLGLSGTGEGGGKRGDWIGMGEIGTCGSNCGLGTGSGGFGRGVGLGSGKGHQTKSPRIRPDGTSVVSGRLPAEVIQRVVRQNYGRFRACYESGLRANPNLTGRVTARFIIGRDGAVSNAANGGSDLPDSKVVSCVLSQFYGLSFPSPENGIVTVSYPIMFSPG
jgi:hypothetical protein